MSLSMSKITCRILRVMSPIRGPLLFGAVPWCALLVLCAPQALAISTDQLASVQIAAPQLFPLQALRSGLQNEAHVTLGFLSGPDEQIAENIARGASSVDIFIATDEATMDALASLHRIEPTTRQDLVSDRLVLVSPVDAPRDVSITAGMSVEALLGDGKLALSDPPRSPSAVAGKAALQQLGLWSAVKDRVLSMQGGDLLGLIYRRGGMEAVSLVAGHRAVAAIAYSSEAAQNKSTRIAGVFPDSSYPPVRYPIAVVAGRNTPAVQAAMGFLLGHGRSILLQGYGYYAP